MHLESTVDLYFPCRRLRDAHYDCRRTPFRLGAERGVPNPAWWTLHVPPSGVSHIAALAYSTIANRS